MLIWRVCDGHRLTFGRPFFRVRLKALHSKNISKFLWFNKFDNFARKIQQVDIRDQARSQCSLVVIERPQNNNMVYVCVLVHRPRDVSSITRTVPAFVLIHSASLGGSVLAPCSRRPSTTSRRSFSVRYSFDYAIPLPIRDV